MLLVPHCQHAGFDCGLKKFVCVCVYMCAFVYISAVCEGLDGNKENGSVAWKRGQG